MSSQITLGSKQEADRIRDSLGEYLAADDDARKRTIKFADSTPERFVERLESEQFVTERDDGASFGMSELSERERDKLRSTTSFRWNQNGFQAMRAKAALEAKGATEWLDFYEPGEDVGGALDNLEQSKRRSAETGASLGVGGDYVDERVGRSQRRQVERAQAADVDRAILPAFSGDTDAIGFLRDERKLSGGGLFDISFGDDGETPRGRDYERLEEAHAQRSVRARKVDERNTASITRDPLEWATNPARVDYPGIDTVEPERLHSRRSKKARERDEREVAPVPDDVDTWARSPGRYDWPGVDLPEGGRSATIPATPSPERNTQAPEPFTTALGMQDVSLSPEEAFEGVATGSQDMSATATPFGLAGNQEADMAFLESEAKRATGELFGDADDDVMSQFVDDRDRQGSLAGFGMETDGTTYRESREAVESATTFGVDDRADAGRGNQRDETESAQEALFGDVDDDQRGLF